MISRAEWGRRPGITAAVFLAAFTLLYMWSYWTHPNLPLINPQYPEGWWGWFDQSQYLRSIQAFATGELKRESFLYPPFYALISAPFWPLSKNHPTLLPDLICFLAFFGGMFAVCRRFYGVVLPGLVSAGMLVLAPMVTMTQWVIPWTSTPQAALAAILIALYSRAEAGPEPFRLQSGKDWALFAGFFVAYGAIGPSRPLDILVWFPFALVYFLRCLGATVRAAEPGRRLPAALSCMAVAALGGALFVALYLAFNVAVLGSPFGAYLNMSTGQGYFLTSIPRKLVSLFWDSATIYGETNQALFEQVPFLAPASAVCLVTAVTVGDVRRLIVVTILVNLALYLPYGDLSPAGFFRYFNLHYFKWFYPWLGVIGACQVVVWLRKQPGRGRDWPALASALAVLVFGACLGLRPVEREAVADVRLAEQHLIRITAARPRRVDYVDIQNVKGGFLDVMQAGAHALTIDGQPIAWGDYRFFLIPDGVRVLFQKPVQVQTIEFKPDARLAFEPGVGRSNFGRIALGPSCRIQSCPEPMLELRVKAQPGTSRYRFSQGGVIQGLNRSEWWPAEAWGRWSRAGAARAVVLTDPGGRVGVWSTVGVLTGGWRKTGKVVLLVNGCKLDQQAFKNMERRRMGGYVPSNCLAPDGRLRIEWRVDRAISPAKLEVSADARKLGVGVEDLIIRKTPA